MGTSRVGSSGGGCSWHVPGDGCSWHVPIAAPSQEEYEETVRLRCTRAAHVDMLKSQLEPLYAGINALKQEHHCMERLQAECATLRSTLQLPEAHSSNIFVVALQGQISDVMHVFAATARELSEEVLHGATGCDELSREDHSAPSPASSSEPIQLLWRTPCRCTDAPRPTEPGTFTSLMVKHIPARYTKETLFEEWLLDGRCDFLHLPYDFQSKHHRGMAFINFTSNQHAISFARRWQGERLRHQGMSSMLEITVAQTQGFEPLVRKVQAHLKIKGRGGEKYLPLVFSGNRRVRFRDVMTCPERGENSDSQSLNFL